MTDIIKITFDKNKTIRKIIKAEMHYLCNSGWLLYCGTFGTEYYDSEGKNTCWAKKTDPKVLMSQRDAMAIQRKIDGF